MTIATPLISTKQGAPELSVAIRTARVLIADDQTLFRSGLARLLDEDDRVEIVGEAKDGIDAVKLALALKPDVVLMDIKMPTLDGIEATRRIVTQNPQIKVLMLTTFEADNHVIQALKAGASGYVLKDFNLKRRRIQHPRRDGRRARDGVRGRKSSPGDAHRCHDAERILRWPDRARG